MLGGPSLRALFVKQTKINEAKLTKAFEDCDLEDLWSRLSLNSVLDLGTQTGSWGVKEWGGHFFTYSERDPQQGPFKTIENACESLNALMTWGDEGDTFTAETRVSSALSDEETLKLIKAVVSVDDVLELNGKIYRRTETGYVPGSRGEE